MLDLTAGSISAFSRACCTAVMARKFLMGKYRLDVVIHILLTWWFWQGSWSRIPHADDAIPYLSDAPPCLTTFSGEEVIPQQIFFRRTATSAF